MEQKKENSLKKKIFIKTFGCQMNEYDSNRILDITKKINYFPTKKISEADCYIINTCHIREKATEKVFHDVGRVKKEFRNKKKPILIITGCVAQAEGDLILKKDRYVDAVIGPQSYQSINKVIKDIENKKGQFDITVFETIKKFDELKSTNISNSKVSSFLTIQEGCDKFCKFCVVPYTRGPEYSRPFEKIINEAKQLIDNGVKEIILLGQNVNAYNFENFRLSHLILELEKLKNLKRIRYMTSHPKDMTDDLIDIYKHSNKLMPLVHLPVQSGSNKILEKMNRKHTIKEYLEIFNKLKKINPDIEFSSDFIIAYPGENEIDFKRTLNLINEVKFINSFSFIFSPRPGTVASTLPLIEKKKSLMRLEIVQQKLFDNQIKMNKSLENLTIDVLVEDRNDDKSKLFGRSEYMTSVLLNGNDSLIGKIVKVKIQNSNQNTLTGQFIEKSNQKVA